MRRQPGTQHPEEKPGVAVVLKGAEGAGKDILARYIGRMFPKHYVRITQPEHLTGRFNAHMERALFLHVEEGIWAGDKSKEGVYKNLITAETMAIERKGIDTINVKNFMRLWITSNEEWAVPASAGSRRYFVLNVNNLHRRDTKYFSALDAEGEFGGAADLLDYLMDYDLTGFDVRNPPETEGLRDQRISGLRGVNAWWHDVLTSGGLPSYQGFDDADTNRDWQIGPVDVGCDLLRDICAAWIHERHYHGDVPSDAAFGKRLRELVPGARVSRPWVKDSKRRPRVYTIPALAECREAFEKWLGGGRAGVSGVPIEWESPDSPGSVQGQSKEG